MRDMETAPKDGTRILAKCKTFIFSTMYAKYVHNGELWQEVRWHNGQWSVWGGNEQVVYTAGVEPIGWMPSPDNGYTMVPVELTDNVAEAIAMEANCCGGIALDIWDAAIKVARHE